MGGGLVTSGSQSPTWRNPRARWVVRWRAVRSWGEAGRPCVTGDASGVGFKTVRTGDRQLSRVWYWHMP